MKCALCEREIKGRDYIYVRTSDQKEIYVHSAPCEWGMTSKEIRRMVHECKEFLLSESPSLPIISSVPMYGASPA